MGGKDQDTVDGAIKEGWKEITLFGTSEIHSSSRAWGAAPTERRCDQGRVQILRIWGIRQGVWAHSVGAGQAGGRDEQLRGLCRGPEFGF